MKAKGITFQMNTKYVYLLVLKFSQKQKCYPYPNKNGEKRHFWGKKLRYIIILSYILIVFTLNVWDTSLTIKLAPISGHK